MKDRKHGRPLRLLFAVAAAAISAAIVAGAPAAEETEEPQGDWALVEVPQTWKDLRGGHYGSRAGYSWFRCVVTVPKSWDGEQLELFVEAVDDAREVYFNGQRIGGLGTFPPEYRSGLGVSLRFAIDSQSVLFGEQNVVAIRVHQNESRGGFNVAAPVLFGEQEALRLQGPWEASAGDDMTWAKLSMRDQINPSAAFAELADRAEIEAALKQLDDDDGPLSIPDSLARIQVPDDLVVELAVGEPHVRQPLSMKWDQRGRLWVLQYLQYPAPAGLKMVSRDKYLRTVYDKTPPPPPHHVRGNDKITIHADVDGDGRYERHKTFVDGLSLATSFAIGRGGLFVLNPPYLLFYPDRDGDDVPDGEPDVLLEGFGLEDSHSIANSLRWGPDGWLYACQGSTVSGNIRHYDAEEEGSEEEPIHSMGQLVWRYHPETRRYEIFAEGGGNAFGLEIDSKGRVYSGHNGGDTRGFHYVQGGYFQKGFGKHGQLSNPFAFGYFPPMAHHNVQRFTHVFVIYAGAALPRNYHGKLFGVAPLHSHVVYSQIETDGSSFQSKDLGHPFTSEDKWCRPVDIKVGPDGAIYVADMYEQRIDHASHYQGRIHRESGRIWRVRGKQPRPVEHFDLAQRSSRQLVDVLRHENKWFRQQALRLFGDRRDSSIVPALRQAVTDNSGQFALELLWALNLSGGLNEDFALKLLDHDDPFVRLWTVRLMCDDGQVSRTLADRLALLASTEPNVEARSQLACSARRLPAESSLPIIKNLLVWSVDASDIHLPLLLWWAIESLAGANPDAVLELFTDVSLWDTPTVKQHIVERIMRRYALAGQRADLLICANLLRLAPTKEHAQQLLAGFEEAFQGRSLGALPDELIAAMAEIGGGSLALRVRQGDADAIEQAVKLIADENTDREHLVPLIRILGDVQEATALPVLLDLIATSDDDPVRSAALTALQSFADPRIAERVIALHDKFSGDTRDVAHALLASRHSWSLQLLAAVDVGRIPADAIPHDTVRKILLHQDNRIAALVHKHWGTVAGATSAEMVAEIARVTGVINSGSGIPHNGKRLFGGTCGKCHKLFDDGGDIGPDLTALDRNDLRRALVNVINPSIEIRAGYETYVVFTHDGRTLNGFIVDQDKQVVMLRTAEGQRLIVQREDIEEMRAIQRSIMPDGMLQPLSDQQIRDLFAYFRASQPLP